MPGSRGLHQRARREPMPQCRLRTRSGGAPRSTLGAVRRVGRRARRTCRRGRAQPAVCSRSWTQETPSLPPATWRERSAMLSCQGPVPRQVPCSLARGQDWLDSSRACERGSVSAGQTLCVCQVLESEIECILRGSWFGAVGTRPGSATRAAAQSYFKNCVFFTRRHLCSNHLARDLLA